MLRHLPPVWVYERDLSSASSICNTTVVYPQKDIQLGFPCVWSSQTSWFDQSVALIECWLSTVYAYRFHFQRIVKYFSRAEKISFFFVFVWGMYFHDKVLAALLLILVIPWVYTCVFLPWVLVVTHYLKTRGSLNLNFLVYVQKASSFFYLMISWRKKSLVVIFLLPRAY